MTTRSMIRTLGQSKLALLVFFAGMALTTLAWYASASWDEEKSRQAFAIRVHDTLNAVRQRLDFHIETLQGMRGLFAASDKVTRDEFRRYIKETGLGKQHPGVHSFYFVRYVPASEKAHFVARVRGDASVNAQGYPDFAISPPGERLDYFPVEFVEPEDRHHAQLGVDYGATPTLREALERARDSALPAISERMASPAENLKNGHYLLIVLPIYRNGRPLASVLERRAAVVGFVTARIELDALFREVLSAGKQEALFFEIFDTGSERTENKPSMIPENLLYAGNSPQAKESATNPRFIQRTTLAVAGRNWLFLFGSRAGHSRVEHLPAVVFLGGLVTSVLLYSLVLMLVTQRRRVMAEVVRQKSLFSQVIDALPVNVFLKDKDFRFVLINEESARTLGMDKEAAIGKTNFDVFPHEIAASLFEYDKYVFEVDRLVMREENLSRNGQEKVLLAGKKIIRLPGSSEPMLLGFSFDISERKRAEQALSESEERLRAILDNTTSVIFLKDLKGRYLLINSEYEKRQGFSRAQVIGKTDYDLYPRELADTLRANDQFALQAERPLEFEEKVPDDCGEHTYIAVKFALRNAAGEPYALAGISTDITERLRLEQEAASGRANELIRSLANAVGEGLIGVDLSHQVVFANPKAQEILAIAESEMLGMKLDDIVHAITMEGDELGDATCPAWEMLAEGRDFQSDDWSFRRGDGKRFPVSLVLAPIYDNRQVAGSVMSFQDISLRKRVEMELAMVVNQQKAFLNNLPEMAWLKDTESRYILVNEAVSIACGRKPEEMVGQTDLNFWPAELAEAYRADDRLVMESGKHKRVVEPFEGANGARIWIETIKSPIRDGAGNILGTVGTARDVTERKRAEEDLARHLEKLAYVNAELDEFTYVASHDLQEPVRKLVAFSDLLRKDLGGNIPPRAEQDLGFIVDAALRMQRLVTDLLTLSRTSKVSMVREKVALDDAVDRALVALELHIVECGATIRRIPLSSVSGDLTLLSQLYQNLIGNALKFVGNRRPEISLTMEEMDGEWVFGVRDNGIGIDPRYGSQIFQPFKRLHGRGQFDGSGIGLSICRKVAERHNGRIWVESEEGSGAHFRFTLGKIVGREEACP